MAALGLSRASRLRKTKKENQPQTDWSVEIHIRSLELVRAGSNPLVRLLCVTAMVVVRVKTCYIF